MSSETDRKVKRKKDRETQLREAHALVDKRDRYKCRACGRECNPSAINALERAHRHHLEFRSKGGQDVASNLVTLCPICHDRIHVKRTVRISWETYGADGPLIIWREDAGGSWYVSREEVSPHVVRKD